MFVEEANAKKNGCDSIILFLELFRMRWNQNLVTLHSSGAYCLKSQYFRKTKFFDETWNLDKKTRFFDLIFEKLFFLFKKLDLSIEKWFFNTKT